MNSAAIKMTKAELLAENARLKDQLARVSDGTAINAATGRLVVDVLREELADAHKAVHRHELAAMGYEWACRLAYDALLEEGVNPLHVARFLERQQGDADPALIPLLKGGR